MYTYTDKVIRSFNRQFIRSFRKLRVLKFDEMNALSAVVSVYRTIDRFVRKGYVEIAVHAYQYGLKQAKESGFKPQKRTDFDLEWLLLFLDEEDPVTLYDYELEWERKRQRLSEALAASTTPLRELDKALKYIAMQVDHYADKATSKAVLKAYEDCGVKQVMWVTERDNRVCPKCAPLDGKVFDIDKVPQIPAHYRCRCVLRPVKKNPKRIKV